MIIIAKKTCKYCGIVDLNHKCPLIAKDRSNYTKNRVDYNYTGNSKWIKLREDVLKDYDYTCLWSLFVDGEIRVADCVHHIITVRENVELTYEEDNLIPLNDIKAHRLIHKIYKTKYKQECKKLLRQLKEDWINGIRLEGIGRHKSLVESWDL